MIIQSNDRFGVYLHAAKDYQGFENYLVIYGLQVKDFGSIRQALEEFSQCVEHALQCEDYQG